ncbi:MAG: type II toxin-antitoxin system Phd/YefM family antitoxin [Burkholderiales bacterium]|jgi:prevent-host-death family protein|nr:type II toxin-antitoxin system Phd/YefM family antitoxin [Burkholderiales bacterium]MDP2400249.1 type II toxin-antitoxin system Phd/YefM family antitoxin [Burkholderiales bacterium]
MIREAPAVKVRQNLGELLNEVQYKRDSVVILKDGKPVAALVDIGLFERIQAMEARFNQIVDKFQAAFAELSDEEIEALVDEAVDYARREGSADGTAK